MELGTELKPIHIKTKYVDEEIALYVGTYRDGRTAIVGLNFRDGMKEFNATVWVPDEPAEGCVWLKGWEENEGIPEALVAAGVVRLTGRTCNTGYVEAVEARLLV